MTREEVLAKQQELDRELFELEARVSSLSNYSVLAQSEAVPEILSDQIEQIISNLRIIRMRLMPSS